MPTLSWIGKEKVLNLHNEVPYRILKEKYCYGDEQCGNMIIHGDSLEALKSLLPRIRGQGKVHLHRSSVQHRKRGLGL